MSRLVETPVEIAVLDYGMGNRRSVEKALEHVGASARVSRDPSELGAAAGLVVPGVGAFPRAMQSLRELGLDELLRERVAAGTPVLGICLGMQLAFDCSTELGGAEGLGIVPGEVRALRGRRAEAAAHRLERGAPAGRRLAADRRAAGALRLLPRALLRAGAG